MARQQVTFMVDDLDGERGEDIRTVTFAYKGVAFQIDLTEKNRQRFDEAMAPFLDGARRVASGGPTVQRRPATDREETRRIREWGREQGHKISDRGRIPENVLAAYRDAH